jgi:DhnA family fructose-bisphosphate aldolase class Ia
VGDGSGGGGAAVVPSAVVIAGGPEGEGEPAAEADDGATAPGASGVQAARTVSPAPAARKRAKLRRLVAVAAAPAAGAQW